jgi:hypothetical protein
MGVSNKKDFGIICIVKKKKDPCWSGLSIPQLKTVRSLYKILEVIFGIESTETTISLTPNSNPKNALKFAASILEARTVFVDG